MARMAASARHTVVLRDGWAVAAGPPSRSRLEAGFLLFLKTFPLRTSHSQCAVPEGVRYTAATARGNLGNHGKFPLGKYFSEGSHLADEKEREKGEYDVKFQYHIGAIPNFLDSNGERQAATRTASARCRPCRRASATPRRLPATSTPSARPSCTKQRGILVGSF